MKFRTLFTTFATGSRRFRSTALFLTVLVAALGGSGLAAAADLVVSPRADIQKSTAGDASISDKKPATDPKAPALLAVGEVVTGRLGESETTQKYHYWAVDLPAGSYKFVIDVRRADATDSNIGGALSWVSAQGKELDTIGAINETDGHHRKVFQVKLEKATKGIVRYQNDFTISDYWLGVFPQSASVSSPLFVSNPPVSPLKLEQSVTSPILDGKAIHARDVYYSVQLPAGDYKVNVEFRRADKAENNVGGSVVALSVDGNDLQSGPLLSVNEIASTGKASAKLSVAENETVVFKVRADFTQEIAVFSVEKSRE